MVDLDMDTVDAIAVAAGPGSFTGLRIGSATAKGLAFAMEKPIIPVPTLEGLAWQMYGTDALVCPIMDARRSQVYTGFYHVEEELQAVKGPCAMGVDQLAEELDHIGERVLFLGDGVPVYKEALEKSLKVPHAYAPAQCSRQRAASVAALGEIYMARGWTETAAEHKPEYLRKPQAEREREGIKL